MKKKKKKEKRRQKQEQEYKQKQEEEPEIKILLQYNLKNIFTVLHTFNETPEGTILWCHLNEIPRPELAHIFYSEEGCSSNWKFNCFKNTFIDQIQRFLNTFLLSWRLIASQTHTWLSCLVVD